MVSMSNLAILPRSTRSKSAPMVDVDSMVAAKTTNSYSMRRRLPIAGERQESSSASGGEQQGKRFEQVLSQLLASESESLKRLYRIVGEVGFRNAVCDEAVVPVVHYDRPSVPSYAKGGLTPRTLERVRDYIKQNLADSIRLEILANITGLSRSYFAHAFKRSTGLSPHCFLMQCRLEHSQKLLAETNMPLAQIALASGFSDQSHFSRRFHQSIGITPRSFRQSLR
jgi:AraC-like DNA-binding protein